MFAYPQAFTVVVIDWDVEELSPLILACLKYPLFVLLIKFNYWYVNLPCLTITFGYVFVYLIHLLQPIVPVL